MNYEDFVMDANRGPAGDDIQFYLDGMNEESGEINGVIKRMRRGDYGEKVQKSILDYGLRTTLYQFDKCREDLVLEIGDRHYYETKFLQKLGLNWDNIESLNIIKLKERMKKGTIVGKGDNR